MLNLVELLLVNHLGRHPAILRRIVDAFRSTRADTSIEELSSLFIFICWLVCRLKPAAINSTNVLRAECDYRAHAWVYWCIWITMILKLSSGGLLSG